MRTPIHATKVHVVLDCPDAPALADFYARLVGSEAEPFDDAETFVKVRVRSDDVSGLTISCQQVEDYREPTWPGGPVPQQSHLDFYVDSIAETEPAVLAAGARRHPHQPGGGTPGPGGSGFVVYLDPAGHPFCLCQE